MVFFGSHFTRALHKVNMGCDDGGLTHPIRTHDDF
jgi:hypothetical protein